MTADLVFIDQAFPSSPPNTIGDGIAFYGGGDTPHVWSKAEINAQPQRFRLPIFTRSDPLQASAIADGNAFVSWLHEIGAPEGILVALDSETSQDPNYVAQFYYTMRNGGYVLIDYGSVSSVFGNMIPDGYYWGADWTNRPHIDAGTEMTQWEAFVTYDESLAAATLPFWDTRPAPPPPPPPTPEPNIMMGVPRMFMINVTAPEGHSWQGDRTYVIQNGAPPIYVPDPADFDSLVKVMPRVPITWAMFLAFGGS
jgi:hypothetical protein